MESLNVAPKLAFPANSKGYVWEFSEHSPQTLTRLTANSVTASMAAIRARDLFHPEQVGELVDQFEAHSAAFVTVLRQRLALARGVGR